MNPNHIIVGERLRPFNAERVAELERSIAAIGLQTPITIRYVDGKPILVTGGHRLHAVKNLGWSEIPVREFDGDDRAARMWQIAENLHRAELTVLERSEQLAEWIRLAGEHDAAQVDPHQPRKAGQQPGGINDASRELGIERKAAQRAAKIDSLTDEAKETARDLGLDDNQSALLEAAKAESAEDQVEALKQRQERNRSAPKDQGQQLETVETSMPSIGTATSPKAVVPQQLVVATQPNLDLPFDSALASVEDWFVSLLPSQQSLVLEKLENAHATDEAVESVPERQAEPSQPENEPTPPTPHVEEQSDRVTRLVARFNALSPDRQKWCRSQNRLDKPGDAIDSVKNNQAWSDVCDVLMGLVALSAAELDAFRAQVGVAQATAELEQAA
jgi:hypothetical protein